MAGDATSDLLTVNGEFTTSIIIARCMRRPNGALRWNLRLDTVLRPDITIALRMDAENRHSAHHGPRREAGGASIIPPVLAPSMRVPPRQQRAPRIPGPFPGRTSGHHSTPPPRLAAESCCPGASGRSRVDLRPVGAHPNTVQ